MPDLLLVCGLLVGPSYVFLYALGGALRSGYSHVSNSVSGLLSPGAPNRRVLSIIQVAYALLHVLFGLGVLDVVRSRANGALMGAIGAWAIVAIGVATIGTAIFPQDAEGTPATTAGRVHKILVFGVLVPFTIASMLLIGIWLRRAGVFPWFRTYSIATVAANILLAGLAGATLDTPMMGLTERLAVLAGFQWTFVLALKLFLL